MQFNDLITNGTEQVLKAAPFQCRSMVFLKDFFQKVDFEKHQQTTKSMQNYPVGKELSIKQQPVHFLVVFLLIHDS